MGGMTIMALAGQHPELFGPPATDGAAARPAVAGTAAADPAVAGTAAAGGGGAAAGGGRVIGSVLVSTAASGIDPAGWLPAPLRFAGRQAAPVLLRGVAHGRPAQLVERGREAAGDLAFLTTRWMGFGDSDVGPALVEFAEHMVRATPVAVISEFYLALGEHDQRAALPALGQAPAVVLIGDRDRMVAPRLAGELAAGIPGADLVLVPGAGHLLIMERPGLVTGAITDLLARACPAVPPHPA
jgi:pimeloyl-ACP methyl ester carboxylesterase